MGKLSIQQLSLEDRPREKLLLRGRQQLSNAELLAILIGSGNHEKNAVELSQEILFSVQNNLQLLGQLSVKDLIQFQGIGEAKALTIISALELGRRRKEAEAIRKPKITCSKDVYNYIAPQLLDLEREEFWVLSLSRSNEILKADQISQGGVSGTVVDPKLVFKKALDNLASGLILIHNHPSGNLTPSKADLDLTKKIAEAGKFLEIPVLDHVIFANSGHFSFADDGLL